MPVKAKMYVANVGITQIDGEGEPTAGTVRLQAVTRGAVNKRWAKWTPAGHQEMTINGPALDWFRKRVGKELSVTIADANDDPATHEFDPLEEEFHPDGYREETCATCGYGRESHAA